MVLTIISIWVAVVIAFYSLKVIIHIASYAIESFAELTRPEPGLITWACCKWRKSLRERCQAFRHFSSFPNRPVDGRRPE